MTVRHVVMLAATALTVFAIQPSKAAEPGVKIAVFDFELNDRSAGGGIIGQDAIDTENLKMSTEEARRMLAASGRFSLVDAGSAAAIEVDGGVDVTNAAALVERGVTMLVAGSSIFAQPDPAEATRVLRRAAEARASD